jgi:hypothetical protein
MIHSRTSKIVSQESEIVTTMEDTVSVSWAANTEDGQDAHMST